MAPTIPATLAQTIRQVFGEAGDSWLAQFPALLATCARRWSLTLLAPFPNLSYNFVCPALRTDGTPVVLKLGVPCRELHNEIAALRHYNGQGSARLLDADPGQGALLLERLLPGTLLAELAARDDAQATQIAAEVLLRLHQPPPAQQHFPTTADWAGGLARLRQVFAGGTGPFPAWLVDHAERLFAELLASSAAPVLLHGDLHHQNILAAGRAAWLALDPKGLVGEPAYEVGALLRNPLPELLHWPQPRQVLTRRIDQLAQALGCERERVRGWGCAQAVLSAWWSYEDHGGGFAPALACAELLA